MECPLCNGTAHRNTTVTGVYSCQSCGSIFGQCYKGDSYSLVSPHMTAANIPFEQTRYYDLTVLGSDGITRRHGWYDPASKLITQVG